MSQPQKNSQKTRYVLPLCINTVLFFAVYRVLLFYAEMTEETFYSFLVMVLYMALLLGFVLAYIIYNRFFYRKGVTPEQLPDEWSEAKKQEFIEDAIRRTERSRWMLTVIFPLVVTFFIDTVDLFIIDTLF